MTEKNLAPKCYQHSEASRADTTNISSIKIHTNPLRKGEFCPFIVAHFQESVKNRRKICYVKNAVGKFLTALFIATTVARSRKLLREKHVAEQEEQAR